MAPVVAGGSGDIIIGLTDRALRMSAIMAGLSMI